MDIKLPGFRIIRPQHADIVTEIVIRQLVTVNFWVGFVGWYQIYQWVKPLLEKM